MSAETSSTTFGDYVPPIPLMEREFTQAQLVRYAGQLIGELGGHEFLEGTSDAFKQTYLHREPGYPDHMYITLEASRQRYDTMQWDDPGRRLIMPDVWKAQIDFILSATVSGELAIEDCPANVVGRVKHDVEELDMEFEPDKILAQRTLEITIGFDTVSNFDITPSESYEVLDTKYMVMDDGTVMTFEDLHGEEGYVDDEDDDESDEDDENDNDQDEIVDVRPQPVIPEEFADFDFGELAIDMEEVLLSQGRLQAKSFLDLMAVGRKESDGDGRTTPLF